LEQLVRYGKKHGVKKTQSHKVAFVSLCLCAFVLMASCKSAPAAKTVKVTPPRTPVLKQQHVDPVQAAVPTQLKQLNFNDPVDLAILQAQMRFNKGESLYKQGFPKRAKEEFNSAVDLMLEAAATYPKELKVQRQLMELVARINAIELAALREGDGFTDQSDEPAAINDLANIETFPALIDPKLKKTVEDEVNDVAHDLPIEINDRVLGFLNYYQNGRGRSTIELGLERVGQYHTMIEKILKEEGVPLDLIYLCQAESAFQPRALSRAAAKGMWQFISSRGKEYGLRQTWWIDERSDPEKSTRAAARHLKDLYQEFGDWYLAMAAYNSGPVRVQRALEKTGADNFWTLADKRALPRETINYIPNILALTIIGKNPEKYGFNINPAPALQTERVSVEKATDLRVIAEAINMPVEELRALNTHVLRWTTPPDDPDFQLILPKGYATKFNDQIPSLPESKRILFREHVVRRGDTLGEIAKKYGATVAQLNQANNLGKKPVIRVGQTLVIPISGVTPPAATVGADYDRAGRSQTAPTVKTDATKPAGSQTFYTVRAGDTLARIAATFHTTVEKLKLWNHLTSTRLVVGKKLIVSKAAPTQAN
jgi:peptidoglycan lytic transglycosylase D